MLQNNQNARRFIIAYNKIDKTVRSIYNFKDSMSFSDCIRRAGLMNKTVLLYEDELISYSRLRNAIVHKSDDEKIIAEPHDDVVEHIEKISKLISTPPLAINTLCKKNGVVKTLPANVSIKEVINIIRKTGYSNIPIYDNLNLLGIANSRLIITAIAEMIQSNVSVDKSLEKVAISEIMLDDFYGVYYTVLNAQTATVEQVLNEFDSKKKLQAIILTRDGSTLTDAMGILTSGNLLEANAILNDLQ